MGDHFRSADEPAAKAGPTRRKPEKNVSVDGFFQCLASLEARLLGSRDFQSLAGLRVTADTGRTLGYREGTEADQNHGITALQGTGDGFDDCIQRTASSSFRDISRSSDSVNQFRLVHSKSPYLYLSLFLTMYSWNQRQVAHDT